MQPVLSDTKWCHVTWTTFRSRQLFKIAATAQFCERVIRDVNERAGWRVDSVAIAPARLHLLIEVPAHLPRRDVVRSIKRRATGTLRLHRVVRPWERRIWEAGGWCSVLTNSRGMLAVRKYLSNLSSGKYALSVPYQRISG